VGRGRKVLAPIKEGKSTENMSSEEFDALTRGLASRTISRRKALQLAAASALGAAGLGAAAREAQAAPTCPTDTRPGCEVLCTNTKKKCSCIRTVEGRKRCVRPCCSRRTCASSSDCRSTEVCMKTACCNNDVPTCVTLCTEPIPRYCNREKASSASGSTTWS
jgi:hypothetical protein